MKLVDRIYQAFQRADRKRYYLGCSSLGMECERSAWLQYRHLSTSEFSPMMRKLLDHGHAEESRHKRAMRAAGLDVTGDQHSVSALGGILRGHTDGFVAIDSAIIGDYLYEDTVMLWEMKTANAKSFAEVVKHGVRKAKPQHYAQMQLYMGLSDAPDDAQALYMVTNKDTDELHAEVVDFCRQEFDELMRRAERVATGGLPERPYANPDYYKCRFCDASGICWGEQDVPRQCGACIHWSVDIVHGRTTCALTGEDKLQDQTCDEFVMIRELETNQRSFVFW